MTTADKLEIKQLVGEAIDERVPSIVENIIDDRVPAIVNKIIDEKVPTMVTDIVTELLTNFVVNNMMAGFASIEARLDTLTHIVERHSIDIMELRAQKTFR